MTVLRLLRSSPCSDLAMTEEAISLLAMTCWSLIVPRSCGKVNVEILKPFTKLTLEETGIDGEAQAFAERASPPTILVKKANKVKGSSAH